MKIDFMESIPKDPSYPECNEDKFVINIAKSRIALSDGASESFDSKTWASIIVNSFSNNPSLKKNWLTKSISKFNDNIDIDSMSWSKQASYERGSFATLLGIEFFQEHKSIEVSAVGDSVAVLLNDCELTKSFPYTLSLEFKQRPELFCTNGELNNFYHSPHFFKLHHKTWSIREMTSPVLLCMTDALAEWAFRKSEDGTPVWKTLTEIDSLTDFEKLISNERASKSMRIDDSTLIRAVF